MKLEELNLLINASIAAIALIGTLISLYFSRKSLNEISMQRFEKMILEKPVLRFSITKIDFIGEPYELTLQVSNLTKYDAQNILIFSENRFQEFSKVPIAMILYSKESSEQEIVIWLDRYEPKTDDTLFLIYQDLYNNPYYTESSFKFLKHTYSVPIAQSVCPLPILLPKDKYYLMKTAKDHSYLDAPLIKKRKD